MVMTNTKADRAKVLAARFGRRAVPESLWVRALAIGVFDLCLAAALAWVWLLLTVPVLSVDEFVLVRLPMLIVGPIAVLRPARWAPYLAAAVAAVWSVHTLAGFHSADGIGHTITEVGITVAAAIIARNLLPLPMHSMHGAWRLLVIAVAAATARVVAVWFDGSEALHGTRWPAATLAAGAGVSVFVFLPLAKLVADGLRHRTTVRQRMPVELPAIASLAFLLWLTFYTHPGDRPLGMAFLVIPALAMFAAVLSQLTVAIGLALTVALVTDATSRGLGPLAPESIGAEPLNVQAFLLSVAAFAWFVSGAVAAQHRANRHLADEVAQRTRTVVELERSEERLRRIVHRASIPMSFSILGQGLGEVNDARCAFHERTREELVGMDWRDLTHPEDVEREEIASAPFCRGETDRFSIRKRFLMPDGRVKWGDLSVARVPGPIGESDYEIAQIVDVTAELVARGELQRLVDTDLVTGLRSRSGMTTELQGLLERQAGAIGRVGVMLVELTEFLVVNRTLGYSAGDEILIGMADALTEVAPPGYRIGRFDGHCLVVIAPDVEDLDAIERVAQSMLTVIAGEIVVRGQRISRTGSIGIALSSHDSTATDLLRDADRALVAAKAKGRSRIHLHMPSSGDADAMQVMHLEHELREALDERRFVVHFQPQVWLETGLVCGYEALARWDHPQRGILAPSAFIETMESSGLVIQLGQQVLECVCHVIASTPDLPGPISVNVSAVEFSDADWFDRFTRTVLDSGIRPELLVVELTETTVLNLTDDTAGALAGLRSLGVGIHIDDFGTGFASVGLLQRVPATALKLDRSFVASMQHQGDVNVPLVRGIAGLAEGMGLETIAEGIETPEQADLLRDAGWRIGQGYFFGRPGPDLVR
jgi:diguanylate cyclase (GGDEF)-like protein/PAS domain S-box-containing protein